ncbi:hypothetical protein AB205_0142830, partial [Aquarana catesbeiana]
MIKSIRMEEDWSHMTERILNLTLEIIYLLTGERFPLLKSGDHMTITVPPCDSLKPERHNMQKILEVTKKMMELLTGESGNLRDSKVEVKKEIKVEDDEDGVMGKSEILKKHKDLYQDTMIGNLRDSKVEVKVEEEEMYVGNDHQSMEEDGIIRLIIEEDTPTEISK